MKKHFPLATTMALMLAASAAPAWAYENVRGVVVDKKTNKPLFGATIRLQGTQMHTLTTDTAGTFLLENLPDGVYSIEIRYIGYNPERVDSVALSKENIGSIVDLMMKDLNKRLADQEITLTLDPSAKEYIIDGGYDPVYGARPLKRYLQKNVETLAAKLILSGKVGMEDEIVFTVKDGELTADVKPKAEVIEAK